MSLPERRTMFFLNIKKIRKSIKNTFKTGLVVAEENGRLYMSGRFWELQTDLRDLPKEIKAQLIELIGELPEGVRWKCDKNGAQLEFGLPTKIDIGNMTDELETTDLILKKSGDSYRLVQDMCTGKIHLLDEEIYESVIKIEEVYGPYLDCHTLLWISEETRFKVLLSRIEDETGLLDDLSMIQLAGKVVNDMEEEDEEEETSSEEHSS